MKFRLLFIALLLGFGPVGHLAAERVGEFEDVQWGKNTAASGFDLSWTGKPDRYYFIEQSPDLSANSWSLFPYAVKGDGSGAGLFFDPSPNRFFFRLRYTDDTAYPLLLEDFNESGFSNRDELDIGANPFDDTDTNNNGVPDHIEAFWANEVPESWKQTFADDPNKAFYDPENAITGPANVLPGDDYDGDGRSNLREYLDGTDPTDFFNGATAFIRARRGDSQTATPGTWMGNYLIVSITDGTGAELTGAPVRYSVDGGHAGLATGFASPDRSETIFLTNGPGSRVAFEAPNTTGTSTVTATLPNGENLTFTLYTVDANAKGRQGVTNFKEVKNADGTTTYTWDAGPAAGDFFKLQELQANGTWFVFYETTYGSADLPYTAGQTQFSLTLDNE